MIRKHLTSSLGFLLASTLSASTQSYTFSTVAGTALQQAYVDGTNGDARFSAPAGTAIYNSGTMYVADNAAIRKIVRSASDWIVTTFPVSFTCCVGFLAVDSATNLYVSDDFNNRIVKLTPNGASWTSKIIAGGTQGFQDGTNTVATFYHPHGIAMDAQGRILVADTENNAIRLITPIGTNWTTTTIAGNGPGTFGLVDGTNRSTLFAQPHGLALDSGGKLYVADSDNHSIRRITPSGTNWVTTTIAGRANFIGPIPGTTDGTNRAAGFYHPYGIAVDGWGVIYVADEGNCTIRKIVPFGTNWVTTTIGGLARTNGTADGTSRDARFNAPYGVSVDSVGNILVGDTGNGTIRFGVPRFALQASTTPNWLLLSWPASASNFVLETRPSFDPHDIWTPLTSGVALQGGTYFFTNFPTGPTAFFRLRK